ncbi:MAG: alpha-glucosidase C-terminal domain-containing protein [Anaerolineae bacterium]|nr:alpha-glucosidase C-terminal domain-containing protein [Anaerolineae bacterium]
MYPLDLPLETQRTLARLLPRIEARFGVEIASQSEHWFAFKTRLEAHFPRLFGLLLQLYGQRYDLYYHLEELLTLLAKSWFERRAELKELDSEREKSPRWFQSHQMVGGVCYVDLFAGDLAGLRAKIPYFQELGLSYLHLMPLFKSPPGENDGGYAVSSYRELNPSLGTTAELAELAEALRQAGISLVLDLVFNHTASDHEWALRALQNDPETRGFYYIFPDRQMPDAYERTLREIFPDEHPGAFTELPSPVTEGHGGGAGGGGWVWTTFHTYQWDLNYANPAVFTRMSGEMLALANLGVDALRLDAVAFIWKQLGTGCENLPEAHLLIQAFNAVARIAAPGLLFKSEAIVHPDDVVKYISPEECQLSYNPLTMALLWNTLATRQVNLLEQALRERFSIDPDCAWVNYVRCHDDIGWTFSDDDAAELGVNGSDHRRFLNNFYTGRFPGSFARGLPFQENPKTGDCRISGSCASLAGLEKALREETPAEVDLAIKRILLIHAVILTVGGIPLIYLGDEIGTLNDYGYSRDPAKAGDSRWAHRPATDWDRMSARKKPSTVEGRVYGGLRALIELRKRNPGFGGGAIEIMSTGSEQVLGYIRQAEGQRILVFANFSEQEQTLSENVFRIYGLGYGFQDLLRGEPFAACDLVLGPYESLFLLATVKG